MLEHSLLDQFRLTLPSPVKLSLVAKNSQVEKCIKREHVEYESCHMETRRLLLVD